MRQPKRILLLALLLGSFGAKAQQEINLYPGPVPGAKVAADFPQESRSSDGIIALSNVSAPKLYAYLPTPENNTGKAVLIIPGGGYGIVAIGHEGHDIAQAFAGEGISAFVLKYRLPNDAIMESKHIGPLQDAQRGIQLIRAQAAGWNINPAQIGVLGFSAGGHLASTLGTHYQKSWIDNPDGISLRPDFMVLVYPVISMKEGLTHQGSRENLLGKSPGEKRVLEFSNEEQVSRDTPPTFLIHAQDDLVVPIENSYRFQRALKANKVREKLLVYPKGGHGFGLINPESSERWFPQVLHWLEQSAD